MILETVASSSTRGRAHWRAVGALAPSPVLDRWAAALSWALVALSWVGLTLAELGRFSAAGMVLGGMTLFLASPLAGRLTDVRKRTSRPAGPGVGSRLMGTMRRAVRMSLTTEAVVVAGILVLAAFLDARPSEAIFGTHDAGGRLNAAAHLATTGSIPIQDPNLFAAVETGSLEAPLGVYVVDPRSGRVLPQFSGVTEVWEALALASLNPPGSLLWGYATPPPVFPERPLYLPALFGLASLLVLYAALRRGFGRLVSTTATAGLAISYPEITYARLTMAEIPTQLFCAVALFGLVAYWQEGSTAFAALAGAAVGLAYATHVDAVLLYLPAGLWLVWIVLRRRPTRGETAFFVFAAILFVQVTWHYLHFEGPYVTSNLEPFARFFGRVPLSLGLAPLVIVAAATWLWRRHPGPPAWLTPDRRRWAGAGSVVVVSLAAYFLRPLLAPPGEVAMPGSDVPLVANGGVTLVLLGAYVFPLTLLLALVGVVVAIVKGQTFAGRTILAAAAPYVVLFGWNPFVSPPQPFWVRRFVPEAIPFLMIFAALGVAGLARLGPGRRGRLLIVSTLTAAFLAGVALVSAPLWTIPPEFRGGLAQTNEFARALPTNSILVFDQSAAAHWLPLPLTFLLKRDSFLLVDRSIDQNRLRDAVDAWRRDGKTIVFATGGGRLSLDPSLFGFRPLVERRFRFTQFPIEYWAPPTTYGWVDFHASAYELVPPVDQPHPTFPFTLELGRFDYPYLVEGFQVNDYTGQTSYRYTAGHARVSLPRPVANGVRITIRMAGQRPAGVPPAHLRLTLDNRPLGVVEFPVAIDPAAAFQDYPFEASIDATSTEPLDLAFDVNSWRPTDYGGSDILSLGVAVVSVRVEGG